MGSGPSSTGTRGSGRRCSTGSRGHVEEEEARRVFNLGIGYCAVVAEPGRRPRDRPDRRGMIGVLVSGEGTNLQALLDAGLPVARGRFEPARRAGAGARRARPESPRRSSSSASYADREQRDATMANWLAGAGRRARCLRRLHAPAHARLPRPLPGADRQRPPVAAARVPRRARDRRCAGGRGRDDRRDRAPRRRGSRYR